MPTEHGAGPSVEGGLATFAELLRGSPHNLLSPRGLAELESRHFPESVAFSELLPAEGRLLDIGSGGGLPGLVIALARPGLEVHLMDATRKKADFLRDASASLGLGVEVHHGRAEELATGALAGAFDVVTARAVAPLERLVPWAAPYLRPGGRLHAIKGERWAEELDQAGDAIDRSGMVVVATPDGGPGPRVVVLERTTKRALSAQ